MQSLYQHNLIILMYSNTQVAHMPVTRGFSVSLFILFIAVIISIAIRFICLDKYKIDPSPISSRVPCIIFEAPSKS